MRLDHIAYRVKNRHKTATFFKDAFGCIVEDEFEIKFDDGTIADCITLVPPEDRHPDTLEWNVMLADRPDDEQEVNFHAYHAPLEIFVSDGAVGSIVGDWVSARGGVGGIHHIAYQCDDVRATMGEWKDKGYAEFLSDEPMTCPGLEQVFTKPSELTGVIYELICRSDKGFCKDNVKNLMDSTRDL